jgi:3,4-dihydroxy 2-butanone 4-phosphate synthase/GTP cyclohydrolase II
MSDFNSVEEIIAAIAAGEMVVLTDDESRENEGDLIMAADKVTPAAINFMVTHGRGLVCAPLTVQRARELGLELMGTPEDPFYTAFTVSVDAKHGTSTGISADDRSRTICLLADPLSTKASFTVPGHVFPLIAKDGGVLVRPGHTEAAVDLARLAGLTPMGVICEIMNADGTMSRLPQLREFARQHNLKFGTVAALIEYRHRFENRATLTEAVALPAKAGQFDLYLFTGVVDGREHLALVHGDIHGRDNVLVRVHSECLTGDLFGSLRCDCGEQLHHAMEMIVQQGGGAIVYLRQEGRGIGLTAKLRAYQLQDKGLDTVEANLHLGFPADLRDYGLAGDILRQLGIKSVRLMTNNPEKVHGLEAAGIPVRERIPIIIGPCDFNARYLASKREKMGHII